MNGEQPGQARALFTRPPTSPDANARLAQDGDRGRARAINTPPVRRCLAQRAARGSDIDWFVYVASATDGARFDAYARAWIVRAQSGGDIGIGLEQAFREVLDEGDQTLDAIGSDLPGLQLELVRRGGVA